MRFAATVLTLTLGVLSAQHSESQRAQWNRPFDPFHIVANIYYVGAKGVAAYLITTPQGDILLDGGLPETAPLIRAHIESLGFHMKGVKILLNSHAHFDHAGGLLELQRLTHAQFVASQGDAPLLEAGTSFPAIKPDRIIQDGGTVQLGATTLTAHLSPGHTRGCTTWTMPVTDAGRTLNVVFFCSTSVAANILTGPHATYPGIVSDYKSTFAKLRKLPCDIFLGPHGEFFNLEAKKAALAKGGPNPFIDPSEFAAYLSKSEADFNAELIRPSSASSASPRLPLKSR